MKHRKLIFIFTSGLILFVLLFVIGIFRFSGVLPLVAFLNGSTFYITPQTLNLGECPADSQTVAVFHFTNLISQKISIVGERSSCSCAATEKLPKVIPPLQTLDVRINVHLPMTGTFDQTVTLLIQEPDKLRMHPVQITATAK
jgi:hypothetical protein